MAANGSNGDGRTKRSHVECGCQWQTTIAPVFVAKINVAVFAEGRSTVAVTTTQRDYYRRCAEEAEAQAEKAHDPKVKASWRQIAKDWLSMADQAMRVTS